MRSLVNTKYPYLKGNTDFVLKENNPYFEIGITWSDVSSSKFASRFMSNGFMFDVKGSSVFPKENLEYILGFLNSKMVNSLLQLLNPTISFQIGNIGALPVLFVKNVFIDNIVKKNIVLSKTDWDSRETSWDFKHLRIAGRELRAIGRLSEIFETWRQEAARDFFALHHNEEELNRIFIDIYGLQEELTPEVELKDVTILQQELRRDKLSELNPKIRHITNADTALSDGDRQQIIAENAALLTADYFDLCRRN